MYSSRAEALRGAAEGQGSNSLRNCGEARPDLGKAAHSEHSNPRNRRLQVYAHGNRAVDGVHA